MKLSNDPAVARLLNSSDPSVRYLTLTEVLREPQSAPHVAAARRAIAKGQKVRALLAGQKRDGGFGVNSYAKWSGYHWKPPGSSGSNVEVVDWGRRGPSEWVTLRALRVLKAAGELTVSRSAFPIPLIR